MRQRRFLLLLALLAIGSISIAQETSPHEGRELIEHQDWFRQLDELWPTPGTVRTAAGAPGRDYWQQRVDYVIDVTIDEALNQLRGSEAITYHNQSPDELRYLWVQVDPNIFAPDSESARVAEAPDLTKADIGALVGVQARRSFDGRAAIERVVSADGHPLPHTIVDTMMRVDLPEPLPAGGTFSFTIAWSYTINDSQRVGGRTGYERLDDGNCIFELAQWFPRLAAYYDGQGWQIKHYLGRGEFALEFGTYEVRITVPADHIVQATGDLMNPDEVLSAAMRERLVAAAAADSPTWIVTPEEAATARTGKATETRTWIFRADDVRDVAFATSRAFQWDAMGLTIDGRTVMAMSLFPREGDPLWHQYSTRAVAHALDVYSRHITPYPYSKAVSVNGPVGGMEYPMICFNGPRPEKDGTYPEATKHALISVVIHEVGHNFFPMILNTDERQWTWIDEGFNTFVQFIAERAWDDDYPSRRGEARGITESMADTENQVPIMTSSDSVSRFGENAYGKTAVALNILRETVLGRELFDAAFLEYGRRWRFKRPTPYDFFRTMEDASGVDLDWFWRGWFYSTLPCDQAITSITHYRVTSGEPGERKAAERARREAEPPSLTTVRNRDLQRLVDRHPELLDFYDRDDEVAPTESEVKEHQAFLARLSDEEKALLASAPNYYVVEIENQGGLVMPVILAIHTSDGRTEELRLPAEVWRYDSSRFSKLIVTQAEVLWVELDPYRETADIDLTDNRFPQRIESVDIAPGKPKPVKNPMQGSR